MRKRNKCGLFLSLCMAVAWTTQAQTSADGYVIAVEGDDVYIDLAEGKIARGIYWRSVPNPVISCIRLPRNG